MNTNKNSVQRFNEQASMPSNIAPGHLSPEQQYWQLTAQFKRLYAISQKIEKSSGIARDLSDNPNALHLMKELRDASTLAQVAMNNLRYQKLAMEKHHPEFKAAGQKLCEKSGRTISKTEHSTATLMPIPAHVEEFIPLHARKYRITPMGKQEKCILFPANIYPIIYNIPTGLRGSAASHHSSTESRLPYEM